MTNIIGNYANKWYNKGGVVRSNTAEITVPVWEETMTPKRKLSPCLVSGCTRVVHTRGMCDTHYRQLLRKGNLAPITAEDRFWSKVVMPLDFGDCWEWQGASDDPGHGQFWLTDRLMPAHQYAYELFIGPVPDGLELDHLCRNPPCVNPWHLEPVTHKVNMSRGAYARKTHCPKGHPYDADNTIRRRKKTGMSRECRTCVLEQKRLYNARVQGRG